MGTSNNDNLYTMEVKHEKNNSSTQKSKNLKEGSDGESPGHTRRNEFPSSLDSAASCWDWIDFFAQSTTFVHEIRGREGGGYTQIC